MALITQDRRVRRKSIWKLLKIGIDYPEVAKLLLELFKARGDERRKIILKVAYVFELNQSEVVSVSIELLHIAEDDWLRYSIATSLNRVDPENSEAIMALKNLLNDCCHENTKRWVADALKDSELVDLEEVSEVFFDLVCNTQNWRISYWSAQSLGELSNKNLEIARKLLNLLSEAHEHEPRRISENIVHGSKKVFNDKALAVFVAGLKENLSEKTRENNFSLFANSFEIIWHCASRMPYTDFYALWCDPSLIEANGEGA